MVHGGGSCSGGGFSGGGGGGFSSGGFSYGTTYYSSSHRRGDGGNVDCSCCEACCAAGALGLGVVLCCRKQSLKRRIMILWGWIVLIVFIVAMSVSLGTYGPYETEATESDMIDVNKGLGTDFCTGVQISSSDSQFDAYILSQTPKIGTETKNYTYTKSTYVPADKYEYWGYYLLKGSTVRITACPDNFYTLRLYIIRGERNFNKWKKDNYDSETYLTRYSVSCFTSSFVGVFEAGLTEEYYFVFTNTRVTGTSLRVTFELDRTVYDLSNYNQWCRDVRNCDLSYKNMGSSESLVVFVRSAINSEGDATITTRCKQRASLFVVTLFLVPVIVGLILTCLLYLKYRNTSTFSSPSVTGNVQASRLMSNDYQKSSAQSAFGTPSDNPPSYQEATNAQK